jgi:hypothetical protein
MVSRPLLYTRHGDKRRAFSPTISSGPKSSPTSMTSWDRGPTEIQVLTTLILNSLAQINPALTFPYPAYPHRGLKEVRLITILW